MPYPSHALIASVPTDGKARIAALAWVASKYLELG